MTIDDRAAAGGALDRRRARAAARSCGGRQRLQALPVSQGDVDGPWPSAETVDRRRRLRDRRAGAALHRAERHDRARLRSRRRHRLGLDAVPVLHPQGAHAAVRRCRTTRCASSRPRPAAASAARKSTRRCIAGHAALLAWKSGQPVKMIYDRAEDMVATTKRHPSRTRHRTGGHARRQPARDGHRFRARRRRVLHAVAGRALARHDSRRRAVPLPERARSRAAPCATNTPPHGAFRGFGAPQSIFALERHMDKVAAAVGLTPEELRRRNFCTPGETTATGQIDPRAAATSTALLDRALALADYHEKRAASRAHEPRGQRTSSAASASRPSCTARASPARARHVALGSWCGRSDAPTAACACSRRAPKSVRARTRSSRRSPPTRSASSYDDIEIVQPDTARVPNSGPTVASRTVHGGRQAGRVGGARLSAHAAGLLARQRRLRAQFSGAAPATSTRTAPLRASSQYAAAARRVLGRRARISGDAYGSLRVGGLRRRGLGRHADRTRRASTTSSRCRKSAGSSTRCSPPARSKAASRRRIGYALYETVVLAGRAHGERADDQLHHADVRWTCRRSACSSRSSRTRTGPRGAKGIGELPMDGPAPGDRQRGRACDRRVTSRASR